ncbi:unnamed protein product [Sympodiomycopsis kandeliae]
MRSGSLCRSVPDSHDVSGPCSLSIAINSTEVHLQSATGVPSTLLLVTNSHCETLPLHPPVLLNSSQDQISSQLLEGL